MFYFCSQCRRQYQIPDPNIAARTACETCGGRLMQAQIPQHMGTQQPGMQGHPGMHGASPPHGVAPHAQPPQQQQEPSLSLQTGQMFRQYRVEGKIGQGGMGVVYKGLDLNLQRPAALKILPPAFAEQNAEARERFIREARSAAQLIHQNIVTVFEAGDEAGQFYIAMEFVSGPSVSALLKKKGKLEPKVAVKIIKDATAGLEFAHRMNLVHRDIKPDNILLHPNGMAKVADFGLAKSTNQDNTNLTGTGLIVGTPHYMAPEQCEGEETDKRADVYSLGATLYSMILGQPPFQAKSTMAILHKHVYDPVPDPRDLDPDIPQDLANVIMKAMAKKREDRFQSAQKFLDALDAVNLDDQELEQGDLEGQPYDSDIGSSTLAVQIAAQELGAQELIDKTAAIPYSDGGREDDEEETDTVTLLLMALVGCAAIVILLSAFVFRDNFRRIFNGHVEATTTIEKTEIVDATTTIRAETTVLPIMPEKAASKAYTKMLSSPVMMIRHLMTTSALAIVDAESVLHLWDFQGTDLEVPDVGGKVSAIACSPKGDRLAVAINNEIAVYEGAGQRLIKNLAGHKTEVVALEFNPTGGLLLGGDRGGVVNVFRSLSTGRFNTLGEDSGQGHEVKVVKVQFINNQRNILSVSSDGKICLWKPHTRELEKEFHFPEGKVAAAAVGSNYDHSTVVLIGNSKAWSLNLLEDKPKPQEINTANESVTAIAFSWKSRYLAIGTEEGSIHLFDGPTKKLAMVHKHDGAVNSIIFSGGGVTESDFLISGGNDGKVLVEPLTEWTTVKE